MSAGLLREAAKVVRERAEAATPGPWEVKTDYLDTVTGEGGDPYISAPLMEVVAGVYDGDGQNADHIASWHPAVALAVADWLEFTARTAPPDPHHEGEPCETCENVAAALTVARAYLGRSA